MLSVKHEDFAVNRAFYVKALAMADRHIAQGNGIIVKQRGIIVRLHACGGDSTFAEELLVTFLTSQQLHEDDRQRFASKLANLGDK